MTRPAPARRKKRSGATVILLTCHECDAALQKLVLLGMTAPFFISPHLLIKFEK